MFASQAGEIRALTTKIAADTSEPIKVTHIPTGIVAIVECRSQHKSRLVAVEMIEAALTSRNFQ